MTVKQYKKFFFGKVRLAVVIVRPTNYTNSVRRDAPGGFQVHYNKMKGSYESTHEYETL